MENNTTMGSPETELLVVGVEAESCIQSSSKEVIEELLENRDAGFRVQWWAQVIAWESKQLWFLSWADIAAAILNYMLSSVTLVFSGHLGDSELAGASLACLGLQGLSYGLMVGMGSAVQSVCGQAYGAKRYAVMGIICQRSIVLQLVAALLLTFLYWFSGPLLELIGKAESEGTAIAEQAQIFARGLIPQLYAYAVCYPMQRFLQAQNIVNPLAYISLGIFLLHVLLTWLVVDVLGYGLLGAALTLSLSWWILTIAIGFYIILSPSCRETWTGFSLKAFNFKGNWPYFRLTIVAAVMMCLEIWYCQILILISELLPNSTTISVDSISICVTYWNLDCNIMLGMLIAASTRVGNELGAGRPNLAKLSIAVVNAASIIISIVLCAVILIFQVGLIKLYSTDSNVIEAASTLIPLLVISVFINGTHLTLFGVMIGSERQGIMAFVNLVAYYLVGLPIACVLGFKTSLGVAGLYWSLIIGVFLQTTTLSILIIRINWDAEVKEAINRLKKSADGDEEILDLHPVIASLNVTESLVSGFESHSNFRILAAAWESRLLWQLSWPCITASLCNYMLSFVSLLFVGHFDDVELAAASLPCKQFKDFLMGLWLACQPLCGQAYGSKRYAVMGIIYQRAIIFQLGTAFILTFLYWYSAPILKLIGHSETTAIIAEQGQVFSHGLVPQLYAFALNLPMQRVFQAQNIVKPLAYLSLGIMLLHILLTWLGIQVLGFGLLGSALILSLSWWILVSCIGLYIVLSPSCGETWTGFSSLAFKEFWSYFKLSVASRIVLCTIGIQFGDMVQRNSGAYVRAASKCYDLIGLYFHLYQLLELLGILVATTLRIGNELESGHPRVAKLSVDVANGIGILIIVLLSAIIMIFRVGMIKLSTDDSDVFEATSTLIPLLAISVFLSGMHNTLLAVAIGNGQQTAVAFVNVVAYFLIGLSIVYVIGFKSSLGVVGLYWGLIIGVFLQTAIAAVLIERINWNAQVYKAQARF